MRLVAIKFVHNSKKKDNIQIHLLEARCESPTIIINQRVKAFLVQTTLDLNDLELAKWVQQAEVSTRYLDQLKEKKVMSTFLLHEGKETYDAKYSMMLPVVSNVYP